MFFSYHVSDHRYSEIEDEKEDVSKRMAFTGGQLSTPWTSTWVRMLPLTLLNLVIRCLNDFCILRVVDDLFEMNFRDHLCEMSGYREILVTLSEPTSFDLTRRDITACEVQCYLTRN